MYDVWAAYDRVACGYIYHGKHTAAARREAISYAAYRILRERYALSRNAEVLAAISGSTFFPGGLATFDFATDYLTFEKGPSEPIQLQWATYYDAADRGGPFPPLGWHPCLG